MDTEDGIEDENVGGDELEPDLCDADDEERLEESMPLLVRRRTVVLTESGVRARCVSEYAELVVPETLKLVG